jgi:hypothetical protein
MRSKRWISSFIIAVVLLLAGIPTNLLPPKQAQAQGSTGYEFVTWWGAQAPAGQFSDPRGLATGLDGSIYVVETRSNRVQVFSSTGAFLRQWGRLGNGDGEFGRPDGIAVGVDGTVYVADGGNNRIQAFTREGSFLRKWGSRGYGDSQFHRPTSALLGYILRFCSTRLYCSAWENKSLST